MMAVRRRVKIARLGSPQLRRVTVVLGRIQSIRSRQTRLALGGALRALGVTLGDERGFLSRRHGGRFRRSNGD